MKRSTPVARILFSLSALGLLTSCATSRIESWTDPEAAGRQIGTVMIMGIDDSESTQRRYEDLFVESLGAENVKAIAGHTVLDYTKGPVKKQAIIAKVAELGIHSVIITRIIDEKDKVRYVTPMVYPAYYGSYHGFYGGGYSMSMVTGYMENYTTIYVESNLYDAKTEKLVWSGQNIITNDRSDVRNIKSIVKTVVRDLKKNGLL